MSMISRGRMERSKRGIVKIQLGLVTLTFISLLQSTYGASTTATKGKTTMHPAFKNAGQQDGLMIWRIESFEPVPYPVKDYGKFFTGDSYIVLNTKDDKKRKTWDIHFWLGNQTSQDESGSAAILSVNLDDSLDGGPVQHREVQDHESQQFLNYFKSGVRYVPGGVASGFQHVDPNAPVEKALYQVKGKRNVRVRQVERKISSMNKGDCFILDSGRDIYVYVGEKSKGSEKVKAISAASQVRDQDHAGRGKIYIIDSSSTEEEVSTFFTELGSGSPSEVPREPPTDDDQTFERNQDAVVSLFKVSDVGGQVTSVKVAQKPLSQQILDTNDCFVLDTVTSGIFVWIGKKGTTQEKVEALKNGQAFLAEKKYPSWTHIKRVVEGAEPTAFKQYFSDWEDMPFRRGSTGGSPIRRLRSVTKHCGPAVGFMPDEGTGGLEIFRIENFEMVPVDPNTYGKFFGGDSYVIKYTYVDHFKREKYIVYFWQGKDSTQDEKTSAALHALRMENDLGGRSVQVRVTQGNEPSHFLRLFKGKMIVFLGGHASGFRNVRDHDTYDEDGTRLFEIRGTCSDDLRAVQVTEAADSLDSDYAYVLETPNTSYLWIGEDCPPKLSDLAESVTALVAPDRSIVTVNEGDETPEFWECLGGQGGDLPKRSKYRGTEFIPKLFHCYMPFSRKLKVEEIISFTQQDLFDDDVMVLDSGDLIYVWIGDKSSAEEKQLALKMAEDYLEEDTSDRRPEDTVIVTIKQGDEPQSFINLFPEWDTAYWEGNR